MLEFAAGVAEVQEQKVEAAQPMPSSVTAPLKAAPKDAANTVEGVEIIAPIVPPEPEWARKYNFDVRGAYKQSDTPYLRQRPENGCKMMAGGSKSPAGREGVAAGLVCAKRF